MRGLKASEAQIENQILIYLQRVRKIFCWKQPNGGYFDSKRKIFRKQVSVFTRKGVADILGIYRGLFIGIEVKSATGRQSVEQKDFQNEMTNHGGYYCLARSLLDVENFLRSIDQELEQG